MREFNVGLIGLGFIGKVHALAYRNIPFCYTPPAVFPRLQAVLRSNLQSDPEAMQAAGFNFATTSLDEFLSQPLDLVDICTPNDLHLEQVSAALERKIPVYCEKPLAKSLAEARQLTALADRNGVHTHTAFMNRYYPAIRQMKAVVDAGLIGTPHTFRAQKYHSSYMDPSRPMSWRLRNSSSGGGAMMDLGIHLVDMLRYLLGDVSAVRAEMRTIIQQRPTQAGSSTLETVDVDDWTLCTFKMANGAMGTLETTRLAAGSDEQTSFEIYGTQGSVLFSDKEPQYVQFYDQNKKAWSKGALEFSLPASGHPIQKLYPLAKLSQGEMINRHMASIVDFLMCLDENRPSDLNFHTAYAAQEIVEASYRSAAHAGAWIQLPLD